MDTQLPSIFASMDTVDDIRSQINTRAPVGTSATTDRERIQGKLQVWRERLVDLTGRNPLLGINRSRTSKLRISAPEVGELFDSLVVHEMTLRLPLVRRRPAADKGALPLEAGEDGAAERNARDLEVSQWVVQEGDIRFDAEAPELRRRLRRIRDNARATVEERGVTTLHLTIGAVCWDDAQLGPSVAPLWLIPCELESDGPDEPLRLRASDEDPQLNPALAIYLRERHGKQLPSLPEEPAAGVVGELLQQAQCALGDDFQVSDESWLSTFSFETLTMYQDLDTLAEEAVGHDVIRAFCNVSVRQDPGASERLGDDLDAPELAPVLPIPVLPADSSQLEALGYARQGRHLLIYGPPGTGKSQTITNLIADSLGQGKTVLFVSAKKAALDVVHDRLSKLGFGRFCLEAHSTKAGKRRVIDELRRALDAAGQMNGADDGAALARHVELRARLNEAVRELHRRRDPLGRSVYEGLGQFARYQQLPALWASLPWPDPTTVDGDSFQKALDLLGDLQAEASTFAERETHPWRGCIVEDAGYATTQTLLDALQTVRVAATSALDASKSLAPFVGMLDQRSFADLEQGADAFRALVKATWLPPGWTTATVAELEAAAGKLGAAAEQVRSLADLRSAFAAQTDGADPVGAREVLAPALDRFAAWYKRVLPSYLFWKREVRERVRPKTEDYRALAELARLAGRIAEAEAALEAQRPALTPLLHDAAGPWPDVRSLDEAAAAFQHAATIRQGRARLGSNEPNGETVDVDELARAAAERVLAQLPSANANLVDALDRLRAAWGGAFVAKAAPLDVPLASLIARCSEVEAAPKRLTQWVTLRQALDRCEEAGLGPFIAALQPHGSGQAVDLFLRLFWLLWVDAHIAKTPVLTQFSGQKRGAVVQEFAALDEQLRKLAISAAIDGAARRAAQISQTSFANRSSQLGILQRELQKKRPRPLRKLFTAIPQVLQAIKPCMLMSPVSVSTYLAPGAIKFDTVVFDEASQLPPAEAIPAILRARQVIVAGDDKQLPPTSFFSSALFADDEADDEAEDTAPLESLLHECQAVAPFFQPTSLRWHYRSRDERLIAFSNHTFYEGSLITFPSPSSPPDRGVQLRYVSNGVWDRGKSRTNRAEARVVADLVVQHLDEHPDRTIGVATLNVSQKEAVEDALEEVLLDRADLRARLYDEKEAEPFFVKSLENVQGDERDTIIISTGYGPDPSGIISLNFGPLNQDGGWRRLNVLVTRARYLTILVTSLRSADLRAVSPDNRGATALRQFIEYVERGDRLTPEAARLTGAETNDFEDAIAQGLRARGLQVDEQVGASNFRIDLAIRDPRDPDRYLLGVECDGATYHSSRTARDRDVLRAEMLRKMGWRLHRIWSVDWFRNPEQELDAAVRAVQRAMAPAAPEAGVPAPPVYSPPVSPPPTVSRPAVAPPTASTFPAGVPYREASRFHPNRDLLLADWNEQALADEIARVVAEEGPIHVELALRRVRELNGVGRAGKHVRANFERALKVAVRRKGLRRDQSGFLWARNQTLTRFRSASSEDEPRAIEHIPVEEIRLAVLHVVESQFGLPREDLVRQAASELGFQRTSTDIAKAVGTVVDELIRKGELRRSGFQIRLP